MPDVDNFRVLGSIKSKGKSDIWFAVTNVNKKDSVEIKKTDATNETIATGKVTKTLPKQGPVLVARASVELVKNYKYQVDDVVVVEVTITNDTGATVKSGPIEVVIDDIDAPIGDRKNNRSQSSTKAKAKPLAKKPAKKLAKAPKAAKKPAAKKAAAKKASPKKSPKKKNAKKR